MPGSWFRICSVKSASDKRTLRTCWASNRSTTATTAPSLYEDYLAVPPTCNVFFLTTAGHSFVCVRATEGHGYHSIHLLSCSNLWGEALLFVLPQRTFCSVVLGYDYALSLIDRNVDCLAYLWMAETCPIGSSCSHPSAKRCPYTASVVARALWILLLNASACCCERL